MKKFLKIALSALFIFSVLFAFTAVAYVQWHREKLTDHASLAAYCTITRHTSKEGQFIYWHGYNPENGRELIAASAMSDVQGGWIVYRVADVERAKYAHRRAQIAWEDEGTAAPLGSPEYELWLEEGGYRHLDSLEQVYRWAENTPVVFDPRQVR